MAPTSLTKLRRRLTLSHDGRPFLERWGLVHERIGGFYLHHIAGPDPGMDLHDHPWAFATVILTGGYTEEVAPIRDAALRATRARQGVGTPGVARSWRWLSIHWMPLHVAHRITAAKPGTWTLVLRGPTHRRWGFYLPGGWIDWERYPYEKRRPSSIDRDTRITWPGPP